MANQNSLFTGAGKKFRRSPVFGFGANKLSLNKITKKISSQVFLV
jgi:hypothetical protein